ncbi:MAG: YiiD C-terminal domain-containing protein [Gammaproteobacteria bacterium]
MNDHPHSLRDSHPLALSGFGAAGEIRLEAYLHQHIPLVRHMQIHVATCDTTGLTLTAPLAANINHQATAFGGSLASLATLAGWGLLWLLLEQETAAHIVVNESRMQYLHPVTQTLVAHCLLPDETTCRHFIATLERRNKARIELKAEILQNKTVCARFTGSFVAFRGTSDAPS